MSVRLSVIYEDHLWYPILVTEGGQSRIVEMQGKEMNAWKRARYLEQLAHRQKYPKTEI